MQTQVGDLASLDRDTAAKLQHPGGTGSKRAKLLI